MVRDWKEGKEQIFIKRILCVAGIFPKILYAVSTMLYPVDGNSKRGEVICLRSLCEAGGDPRIQPIFHASDFTTCGLF